MTDPNAASAEARTLALREKLIAEISVFLDERENEDTLRGSGGRLLDRVLALPEIAASLAGAAPPQPVAWRYRERHKSEEWIKPWHLTPFEPTHYPAHSEWEREIVALVPLAAAERSTDGFEKYAAELEAQTFSRYSELFPNYAWTDARTAIDLIAAEILTLRKECAERPQPERRKPFPTPEFLAMAEEILVAPGAPSQPEPQREAEQKYYSEGYDPDCPACASHTTPVPCMEHQPFQVQATYASQPEGAAPLDALTQAAQWIRSHSAPELAAKAGPTEKTMVEMRLASDWGNGYIMGVHTVLYAMENEARALTPARAPVPSSAESRVAVALELRRIVGAHAGAIVIPWETLGPSAQTYWLEQAGRIIAATPPASPRAEGLDRWLLEKATIRLEILAGRMRACPSHEAEETHTLSLFEVEGWVEEQRDALERIRGRAPTPTEPDA